jgi:hypothetical protein
MILRFAKIFPCLIAGSALFCCLPNGFAQGSTGPVVLFAGVSVPDNSGEAKAGATREAELPDAPQPQDVPQTQQTPAKPDAAAPAQSSSSQQQSPQTEEEQKKAQHDLADEQLKQQTKQRVLGIVPNFNTSYVVGAAPLTSGQKFKLAFRSQIDPAAFGIAGFVALIEQAEGSHYAYGGGWGGYGKRYGQSYADSFDGQILGNALLPSLLHQDPRYFRLGRGPVKRRILYALGTNVLAHHDGTGRWEPNYSNVLGNFAAGGISNIYLPANERGFGSTITGGLVVIAEGGVGSMFQEFWPDIARRFLHKDPTDGQDAINKMKPDPNEGHRLFYNPPKHPKADD